MLDKLLKTKTLCAVKCYLAKDTQRLITMMSRVIFSLTRSEADEHCNNNVVESLLPVKQSDDRWTKVLWIVDKSVNDTRNESELRKAKTSTAQRTGVFDGT